MKGIFAVVAIGALIALGVSVRRRLATERGIAVTVQIESSEKIGGSKGSWVHQVTYTRRGRAQHASLHDVERAIAPGDTLEATCDGARCVGPDRPWPMWIGLGVFIAFLVAGSFLPASGRFAPRPAAPPPPLQPANKEKRRRKRAKRRR